MLIGVDKYVSSALWCIYFLQMQWYEAKRARIYLDIQSAILLDRNGLMSSSCRARNIKSKYFFITNRIEDGEFDIKCCPTNRMRSDCNTKSRQGKTFRFRRHINYKLCKQLGSAMCTEIGKSYANPLTFLKLRHFWQTLTFLALYFTNYPNSNFPILIFII